MTHFACVHICVRVCAGEDRKKSAFCRFYFFVLVKSFVFLLKSFKNCIEKKCFGLIECKQETERGWQCGQ